MEWKQKFTINQKRFQCNGRQTSLPVIRVIAKRIANNFNFEVKRTTKKVLSAGFPRNVIWNTIAYFNKDNDDFIIPEWLFDEQKLIIIRLSFSESNEKSTKSLKNIKCKFNIVQNTRIIRSL